MSIIKLTLPVGEFPVNGKQISFKAPCPCSETEALQIDGVQYTVVDSLCQCVTGIGGRWDTGSIVSVILDVDNQRAFLQNEAAVSKAGDKMSGDLSIVRSGKNLEYPTFKATNTNTNRDAFLQAGTGSYLYLTNQVAGDDKNRVAMWLAPETAVLNNLLRLNVKVNNVANTYNVLHTGNGGARIQVRTYFGNGRSDEDNPNTLTFDFVPKIVIVGCTDYIPVVLINGVNQANRYSFEKEENVIWTVAWNDKTVEWFMRAMGAPNTYVSTADAEGQMNESGKMYTAIAIG